MKIEPYKNWTKLFHHDLGIFLFSTYIKIRNLNSFNKINTYTLSSYIPSLLHPTAKHIVHYKQADIHFHLVGTFIRWAHVLYKAPNKLHTKAAYGIIVSAVLISRMSHLICQNIAIPK